MGARQGAMVNQRGVPPWNDYDGASMADGEADGAQAFKPPLALVSSAS